MESAQVLVESAGFNNWLNANYAKLDPRQMQGVREHLHVLIDSRVKELYAQNKLLRPQHDPLLAMLYSWAGRLGVYGADPVYAAVRGSFSGNPPPGPRPPVGLTIDLRDASLHISSTTGGWQASVPFHFFVFVLNYVELREPSAKNVGRTEAAIISTGSAPVVMPPGYSQATIAVYFTAGADMEAFASEWCERLQIRCATAPNIIGQSVYRSRAAYDEKTQLHKEVVFANSKKGAFVILYSGLDGTYQANRPHFIDFLTNLELQ